MATLTNVLGFQSGGTLPNRFLTGDTLDFSAYTVLGVTAQGITDGIGTLEFDGSGNLTSTSIGTIGLDGTTVSIGGTDDLTIDMTANAGTTKTFALSASNAGAGVADLTIECDGASTYTAGTTLVVASAGASSWTVTGADLTLEATGAGLLYLTGAAGWNLGDGVATFTGNGSGAVALTIATGSATGFSLKDTAGSPVTYLAVNSSSPRVTVGSSLARLILDGTYGQTGLNVITNQAAAFTISDNAGSPVTLLQAVTTTGAPALAFSVPPRLTKTDGTAPLTQAITAGGTFTQGDVLAVNGTSGRFEQADANGTGTTSTFAGVAYAGGTSGNASVMAIGGIASVTFDTTVATSDIGKFAYLSATAGQATFTAPTASGTTVYKIGIITLAAGTNSAQVLLQPQFLSTNA